MIIGTAIVYDQLQHQRNIDKGFDPEQVMTSMSVIPDCRRSYPSDR